MSEFTGQCACGAIRYEIDRTPLIVHACHCRDCQRLTGSAFAVNLVFERNALTIPSGTPVSVKLDTSSGEPQEVFYCDACSTNLWSKYHSMPYDVRYVRGGALNEADKIPTPVHVYTRSKRSWATIPEDAPAFAETSDMNTVWPAESLARLEKVAL